MVAKLAYRMFSTVDKRLLWKFAYNFGYKGMRNPHIVVFSPDGGEEVSSQQFPVSSEGAGSETDPSGNRKPETDNSLSQQQFGFSNWYVCPKSLVLRKDHGPCPLTNDPKRFRVRVNMETRQDQKQNTVEIGRAHV